MTRLGANASRRIGRLLQGLKCPSCRQRLLLWVRKDQVVTCGYCGAVEPLAAILPDTAKRYGMAD